MKMFKRLAALMLAGVLALSVLTGCSLVRTAMSSTEVTAFAKELGVEDNISEDLNTVATKYAKALAKLYTGNYALSGTSDLYKLNNSLKADVKALDAYKDVDEDNIESMAITGSDLDDIKSMIKTDEDYAYYVNLVKGNKNADCGMSVAKTSDGYLMLVIYVNAG